MSNETSAQRSRSDRMKTNGLADARVVVTGGSAGIGLAVAQHFAALGARVAVLDKNPPVGLEGVEGYRADVTDQEQVNTAMRQIAEKFGGIDVLVNNAGASFVGTVEDGSMEDWHRLFDLNVLGYVRTTRAALPYLRKSAQPAIVNVS